MFYSPKQYPAAGRDCSRLLLRRRSALRLAQQAFARGARALPYEGLISAAATAGCATKLCAFVAARARRKNESGSMRIVKNFRHRRSPTSALCDVAL